RPVPFAPRERAAGAPAAGRARCSGARRETAPGAAPRAGPEPGARPREDPRRERRPQVMTHRILVVDDEPDITALVAYHLAREGYRVSTAGNGQDALKAAREERPEVVVLDLMLPGVSGYEVLRELRKRKETSDMGIILLTARREEADRIKGLSL